MVGAPDQVGESRIGPHEPRLRDAVLLGTGLGLAGVALVVLIHAVTGAAVYAPLIVSVILAAWRAGVGGSIASIATGGALVAAATPPSGHLQWIDAGSDSVRLLSSLAICVLVAIVIEVMRRGQRRAALAAAGEERTRLGVERLQALAASLSAALTVEEVAGVMVDGVPTALGSTGAALGLVEGDELVIVDPRGARGLTLPAGTRLPLSARAPITTAAREGRPAWAQRRQELVRAFPDALRLAPYAVGALGVPVFVGERLAGSMGFPFADEDAITPEIRTVARIAADLGGQALERAGLYELERSSREALDRILAVAPRFQQDASPEGVAMSICAEAKRAFGCDVAQLWTPVDDEVLEVTWRDPPHRAIEPEARIPWVDFPGLLDEMRAFRSMFVPNAQRHTRGLAHRHALQVGVFSSLRIPIVIGARFERILVLQWERIVPEPAPSVMAVMRRFADQAGLAIEQAERRRAEQETRALQAVTAALAAAATPADVGAAIVREGVRAIGADGAAVFALTEDGAELELVAGEGYPEDEMERFGVLPLAHPAAVTEAVTTGDVVHDATHAEVVERFPLAGPHERSHVAAPLLAGGRVIGGIVFGARDEHRFESSLGLVLGVARQAAQALDRAQLFERERAAAGRLLKLQAVTAALSQAVTLEDVSRTCLEHAVTGVGAREGVVVLARGSGTPTVAAALGTEGPVGVVPPAAEPAVADALQLGAPATSEEGWIALPLGAGALAVRRPARRPLATGDREWLVTLAGQGAQALDRASRYETERAIAETMQRSVLPERLPLVGGVTLAARYLPGTTGVDVGGDWYDVVQLDDGRLGLCVGDVVGKGVQAAAMMGQLRNALRAFAFEHDDPHEVVGRLDRLVEGTMEGAFATLAYLVVDPEERTVRYVVAGHPPPLIRALDGSTGFLEHGRSLPIGVDASLPFHAGEAVLEEGATILLYTDGLVERHGRPLDEGLEQLSAAVARDPGDPEELVDAVLEEMIGESDRPDDVAVMAVRLAASVIDDLELVLPSSRDGLVEMREELRAWLERGSVGSEDAAEAVLAVWEACANAVEHAQDPADGTFTLRARLDDRGRIRVEVRDSGQWKPGEGSVDRGLGLGLMRSLMDTVRVTPGDEGTEVVLERVVHLPYEV